MSELSQEQIKVLEQTRQLLIHLTESLRSFHRDLQGPQLPPWSSITSHSSIVSVHLQAYYQHLSQNASFLGTLSAYPLPSFPGKTQEIVLGQILRKKLDPEVEEWASQAAEEIETAVKVDRKEEVDQGRLLGLWKEALLISNECAKKHSWGQDYTNKEVEEGRENVVTGLKRKWEGLDEGKDEYEAGEKKGVPMVAVKGKEAEGEKKDGVAMQPAPLSHLSSFMTRGPLEPGTDRK